MVREPPVAHYLNTSTERSMYSYILTHEIYNSNGGMGTTTTTLAFVPPLHYPNYHMKKLYYIRASLSVDRSVHIPDHFIEPAWTSEETPTSIWKATSVNFPAFTSFATRLQAISYFRTATR